MGILSVIKAFFRNDPEDVPASSVPAGVRVAWLNRTTDGTLTRAEAALIVQALSVQAPDLAASWSLPVAQHVFVPMGTPIPWPKGSFVKAYFLNNSDQAGALGYHSVDPEGDPYVRVFVEPVLSNGGSIFDGPVSVSVCASHEACELAVDPSCTQTVTAPSGDVWAKEVGDPFESDSYTVSVGGKEISVSDFALPNFFAPQVPEPVAVDHLGNSTLPFTLAPGGYAVINGQEQFAQMRDGSEYPEWRKATKTWPTARTFRRTHTSA